MAVPEFTIEELQSEEWRLCVGLGVYGRYEVSSLGRLRYVLRNGSHRVRKISQRGENGYLFTSIQKGGGNALP